MDDRDEARGSLEAGRLRLGVPMRPNQIVGARLRLLRVSRGLSQEQVGAALQGYLGMAWSKQMVSATERGRRPCDVTEFLALAAVLEVPAWRLLEPSRPDQKVVFPGGRTLSGHQATELILGKLEGEAAPFLVQTAKNLGNQVGDLRIRLDELHDQLEAISGGKGSEHGKD